MTNLSGVKILDRGFEVSVMDGPLSGLRVIDSTTVYAMPTAMYMLGDMGAEVIKVENPAASRARAASVFPDNDPGEKSWNRDGGFHRLHRSKYSIALNLKQPEAVEVFKDLVRTSDVLAENNRPGVMARLGLDYESLYELNPRLVYFSFSGFGQTGPWKDFQGIGRMFELTSGVSQFTGYPDEGPRRVGAAWFDPPNGWMAVFAILSALHHRNLTGKGQRVDFPMYQMGVATVGDALLDYIANGRNGQIMGNRHPFLAPYGVYPCKGEDQWIAIAIENDKQWLQLCQLMGTPLWVKDDKFSDGLSRWHNQDELDYHLGAWTSGYYHTELMTLLSRASIPSGAVMNAEEVLTDSHMKDRKFFEEVKFSPGSEMGSRIYTGRPWKMSKTPSYITKPPPDLGEHNEFILTEMLGRSKSQIDELYSLGAITKEPVPLPKPEPRKSEAELLTAKEKEVKAGTLAGYDPDYKSKLGMK